jgi:Flp pilus assembly pilin Flp
MIRKFSNALRKFTRDERGNNLIAYALILGAVGIAGAGYLANVSTSLKAGLNNQGAKLAQTAGTTWTTPGSPTATSPTSPTITPTPGTPTSGTPTTGSGSGSGKGKGKGKK